MQEKKEIGAGDGTRTHEVQPGKHLLEMYQKNITHSNKYMHLTLCSF